MNIEHLREEYKAKTLNRADLLPDPIGQFTKWFEQAQKAQLPEPNAMCLSTVSASGRPSSRLVLLKYFDHKGFIFFTNTGSQKAEEIAQNARVALLFPWIGLHRQVRIEGSAIKISNLRAAKYFATRPRGSQLGAWVSNQSEIISSKKLLIQKFAEMKNKFLDGEISMPEFWGGYRVIPDRFEFWQGQKNRLHDRFEYCLSKSESWIINRLQP